MESTVNFQQFLANFIPPLEKKFSQVNRLTWLLETTGSEDAAEVKAELDAEMRLLLQDRKVYEQLLFWEGKLDSSLLERERNVLARWVKQNQVEPSLLAELAKKEAQLGLSYTSFRPELDGKKLSENEIREGLKKEKSISQRMKIWEASKQIGPVLAPQILELVHLRNQMAAHLGYSDFFQMQLDLQEVDRTWLFKTFDAFAERSQKSYEEVLGEIQREQAKEFSASPQEMGPWSWSDPFCQEDPLDTCALDCLVEGVDIIEKSTQFYDRMGLSVRKILERSDMFERPNKNGHAFCIHIDRKGDIRTLNNVSSSIKWLETVLHEYGHAVYEEGLDPNLPWLLREPPHMITTEAMALLAGRQAYKKDSLQLLVGDSPLLAQAEKSLRRRQLIFSRWALVMTAFESALYQNPTQDLQSLWWECVEKYQKISRPPKREGKADWAAKYHIGLAPVYYFSYLLGEMFASAIQEALVKHCGSSHIATPEAGIFLRSKLFFPGNRMHWNELVRHVTGETLSPDAWLREFGHI